MYLKQPKAFGREHVDNDAVVTRVREAGGLRQHNLVRHRGHADIVHVCSSGRHCHQRIQNRVFGV